MFLSVIAKQKVPFSDTSVGVHTLTHFVNIHEEKVEQNKCFMGAVSYFFVHMQAQHLISFRDSL